MTDARDRLVEKTREVLADKNEEARAKANEPQTRGAKRTSDSQDVSADKSEHAETDESDQ